MKASTFDPALAHTAYLQECKLLTEAFHGQSHLDWHFARVRFDKFVQSQLFVILGAAIERFVVSRSIYESEWSLQEDERQ